MWRPRPIVLSRSPVTSGLPRTGYADGSAVPLIRRFRRALEAAARPADAGTRDPGVAGGRQPGGYRLCLGVAAPARALGAAAKPPAAPGLGPPGRPKPPHPVPAPPPS